MISTSCPLAIRRKWLRSEGSGFPRQTIRSCCFLPLFLSSCLPSLFPPPFNFFPQQIQHTNLPQYLYLLESQLNFATLFPQFLGVGFEYTIAYHDIEAGKSQEAASPMSLLGLVQRLRHAVSIPLRSAECIHLTKPGPPKIDVGSVTTTSHSSRMSRISLEAGSKSLGWELSFSPPGARHFRPVHI